MALWGKTDNEASKPKFLSDTLRNDQTISDKDSTLGVDRSEAAEATVTYQWQSVDSASVGVVPLPFVNVSGATSPTLNAGKFGIGDNGTLFRVIVSAVGATPVTSNTVTLTVTAE
jgi:hypothetical protein